MGSISVEVHFTAIVCVVVTVAEAAMEQQNSSGASGKGKM
jgi:hypothetical protein